MAGSSEIYMRVVDAVRAGMRIPGIKRASGAGFFACAVAVLAWPQMGAADVRAADAQQAERFLNTSQIKARPVVLFPEIELSSAKTAVVDTALIHAAEQTCLAQAVYHEARSETVSGQKAVAEVIRNRVTSRFYPNTICGVVYQGSERAKARGRKNCQFSFACDGSMIRNVPTGIAWERAQHVAAISLDGGFKPLTHNATHYHTTKVSPIWATRLTRTKQVGAHVFYQDLPRRRVKTKAAQDTAIVSAIVAP